jgi:hypothetical protein
MNCASCGNKFNDGVQCGACRKHFDFSCANITETGYRRLGPDRRAAWKCPACRLLSPSVGSTPIPSPEVSLESIMTKLNSMSLLLECLPGLIDEVKTIKADVANLQISSRETGERIQEFDRSLKTMVTQVTALETVSSDLVEIKTQCLLSKRREITKDQWSRLNNIEIKGVPVKKNENLFDIVGRLGNVINYKVSKAQINYVSRIPTHNNKDKSIVVSFLNRYVKEDFVASARIIKSISPVDVGFTEERHQRIFVNDHLSPDYKKLLTKCKQLAKERSYQYVWVKFSKIHVRKSDTSHIVIINSEQDLNKLV